MARARAFAGLALAVVGCTVEFPARGTLESDLPDLGDPRPLLPDADQAADDGPPDGFGPAADARGGDALLATPDASSPLPDGLAPTTDAGPVVAADLAAPPPVDSDADDVPDTLDNCPMLENPEQFDGDGDGLGDPCDPCPAGGSADDADGDGVRACEGDCDDENGETFPLALELCDGVDNDCDRATDEDFGADLGAPCWTGVGACEREGLRACNASRREASCQAEVVLPVDEVCNGVDDDCDAQTDEAVTGCCLPGETRPCGLPVGGCGPGEQRCTVERAFGPCDAPLPSPEACNGLDDDCDGTMDENVVNVCGRCGPVPQEVCDGLDNDCDAQVDEGFDRDEPCTVGAGGCRREGLNICDAVGSVVCSATPGAPVLETCNAVDDDCDDDVDEGLDAVDNCAAGLGACASRGTLFCSALGELVCGAVPGPEGVERCNDIDDDCDGLTDEDFEVGAPCRTGVGECAADGEQVCSGFDGTTCLAALAQPVDELCNGLDDDCDGEPDDDAPCGPYMGSHCRVWLVWADNFAGAEVSDTWGACPGVPEDDVAALRCTSTQSLPANPMAIFWDLHATGSIDLSDRLGVRFVCDDPENLALATWLTTHCGVYLGWADFDLGVDNAPTWGPCPGAAGGESGGQRCTSSGFDGRFHSMLLGGSVGEDDDLAVAFVCRDAIETRRAARMQQSINVWLAVDDNGDPVREGAATWSQCPGVSDNSGGDRCMSTNGDGLFHKMDLTRPVADGASFGVGLTVAPPGP